MAEAIVNARLGDQWRAFSAGTEPSGYVHPLAIKALSEIGIQHEGMSKHTDEFREMDFDLVITDQAMPNMTGDVLAGEIKKLKPEIPIILTTGFSARVNEDNYKELGFFAIVMKPWLMSELNLVIQRALTA